MSFTTSADHSESDNDEPTDDNANKPLLSSSLQKTNTTTIGIQSSESKRSNNLIEDAKINRFNHRRSHREKWSRFHIGILIVSFFIVIYFCFSIDLNIDKRAPQIVVDIPPIDNSLDGPRDNNTVDFNKNVIQFATTNKTPIDSYTSTVFPQIRLNVSSSSLSSIPKSIELQNATNQTVPNGFLVWSPSCQMLALDPLARDVMKLFHHEKYETCSSTEPLTYININFTTTEATLVFNDSPKWFSSYVFNSTCCYQEITRSGSGKLADESFKLSSCVSFQKSIKLPDSAEYILVKCKALGKTMYKNTHAIIREKPGIRKRLDQFKSSRNKSEKTIRPLSVLMLSIDSISRLNLIRSMPKTAQHLYDTGWFELQGYNKIDDNTFPNLMAILTGYNSTYAYDKCDPRAVGKLDKCPFIWKEFKDNGYVTSYGEDEAWINTFNYHKTGFVKQPTDYYLRPYMLAAEKNLPIKRKHSLTFCLGYKHSADHIYDFAMDFATHYKNDASFGLYWTNTFSHNDISDPSSMDGKVLSYLDILKSRGILNESMVVFFSDHGLRFGPVRHLITGWMEERLPYIFIWLPEWFRNEHPEIVRALKINRNRLTNPYDLHMTLKHIMQLSNPNRTFPPAESCKNCRSLFTEIPWDRSCEETSIAAHWCTCSPYKNHDKNDKIVKKAVQFVIDDINRSLENYTHDDGKHRLCSELKLKTISYSRKVECRDTMDQHDDYIIVFQATPSYGWFESTVRLHFPKHNFELSGSVSRLDSYASQSKCMKIDYLRKYCFCTGRSYSKNKKG